MENGTKENEEIKHDALNQESTNKPNTENDDQEYTEAEIPYADGQGTLLDDELAKPDEEDQKED